MTGSAEVSPATRADASSLVRLTPTRAGLGVLVLAVHLGGIAALAQLAREAETPPQVVPIQLALVPAPSPQLAARTPEAPEAPAPMPVTPAPPKAAPPPERAPVRTVPPKPAPPKPAPPKPAPAKPAAPAPAPPAATRPAPASPVREAEAVPPATAPSAAAAASGGAPASASASAAGAPAAGEPAAAGPTDTAARFDAAYLRNPAPAYPPLSRRLREEGKVMLRVRVSAHGSASAVEVDKSSGIERLDRAAREAVARWRFVPARRGEQAVEATVLVPIIFKLQGN